MIFRAGQFYRGYWVLVLEKLGEVRVVFSRKKFFGGVKWCGEEWFVHCDDGFWGELGEEVWCEDFGELVDRRDVGVVEMGGVRSKVLRGLVDRWGLVVLRWVWERVGGLGSEWVKFGGEWTGEVGVRVDEYLGRDFELFEVVCGGFGGIWEVDWVGEGFVRLVGVDGVRKMVRIGDVGEYGVDEGVVKRIVGRVGEGGWSGDGSGVRIGSDGSVEFVGEVGWVDRGWVRKVAGKFGEGFLVSVFCSFFDKYVRFLCHKKLKVGKYRGEVGVLESFGYGVFGVGSGGEYLVNGCVVAGDFEKREGCVFDEFVWGVVGEVCRCWEEWVFDESPFEAIKDIVCRYCGLDGDIKCESIPLFEFEVDNINREFRGGVDENDVKGCEVKESDGPSFLDMFDF